MNRTPVNRITINAGGRHFLTTTSTLSSAGSLYFQTLLGVSKVKESDDKEDVNGDVNKDMVPAGDVFVDCDPDLFSEILYFMRRNRLTSKTQENICLLEDLVVEADFFSYRDLKEACNSALVKQKLLKSAVDKQTELELASQKEQELDALIAEKEMNNGLKKDSLNGCHEQELSTHNGNDDKQNSALIEEPLNDTTTLGLASSHAVIVRGNKTAEIYIPPGQILYIVSATVVMKKLAWYGDERHGTQSLYVCYDASLPESDAWTCITRSSVMNHMCDSNLNVVHEDHQKDIRLCLSRPETGTIHLRARSTPRNFTGDYHIVYWIGKESAIPGLHK